MIDFKQPLLDCLSTGPKQPGDIDEELLGSVQWHCINGTLPVYGPALTELLDIKVVKWWRDADGEVWYAMNHSDKREN